MHTNILNWEILVLIRRLSIQDVGITVSSFLICFDMTDIAILSLICFINLSWEVVLNYHYFICFQAKDHFLVMCAARLSNINIILPNIDDCILVRSRFNVKDVEKNLVIRAHTVSTETIETNAANQKALLTIKADLVC